MRCRYFICIDKKKCEQRTEKKDKQNKSLGMFTNMFSDFIKLYANDVRLGNVMLRFRKFSHVYFTMLYTVLQAKK